MTEPSNEHKFSLDDYFHVNDKNYPWYTDRLKERISRIGETGWRLDYWSFPKDKIDEYGLQGYIYRVWNMLNEAKNCYMMGLFNATIFTSSVAVESLLDVIILLNNEKEFLKDGVIEIDSSWYKANSIFGDKYYGYYKGRFVSIVRRDDKFYHLDIPSLKKAIDISQHYGYDVGRIAERMDKTRNDSPYVFVLRRDKAVHGDFSVSSIAEQISLFTKGISLSIEDQARLFTQNDDQALDQYKRAHDFVRDAFAKFDEKYPAKKQ